MFSGKSSPSVSWEISPTQSEELPEEDEMPLSEDAELTDDGVPKVAKLPEPYGTLSCPSILSLGLIQAVYYRVYTKDGAIPSNSRVYSDDPYLARIWAKQVALPRTIMSLKRCLSAVENINNYKDTSLFQSAKSEISMDDASHVSLASGSGPGSTADNPMLLFAKAIVQKAKRRAASRPLLPPREGKTPFKAQYCRFFTNFPVIYLN
jgi:hypothetical protein